MAKAWYCLAGGVSGARTEAAEERYADDGDADCLAGALARVQHPARRADVLPGDTGQYDPDTRGDDHT
jgi:hypothetical protein